MVKLKARILVVPFFDQKSYIMTFSDFVFSNFER